MLPYPVSYPFLYPILSYIISFPVLPVRTNLLSPVSYPINYPVPYHIYYPVSYSVFDPVSYPMTYILSFPMTYLILYPILPFIIFWSDKSTKSTSYSVNKIFSNKKCAWNFFPFNIYLKNFIFQSDFLQHKRNHTTSSITKVLLSH